MLVSLTFFLIKSDEINSITSIAGVNINTFFVKFSTMDDKRLRDLTVKSLNLNNKTFTYKISCFRLLL